MNFCSHCGQPVVSEVPEGDNRPRFICKSCGAIHYENPRMVVGCVPEYQGSILLCRRSIEPRYGLWTVPAGFMELGESLADAAIRETWEEACARVELGALFAVVDVVHARQVHAFFEAILPEPDFAAGEETLEARLFDPVEVPWDKLAFPSVRIALERYLVNRETGNTSVHLTTAPRIRIS
jgi:ADP-ribose pyrophosphatase YjhB (NUDIX family)